MRSCELCRTAKQLVALLLLAVFCNANPLAAAADRTTFVVPRGENDPAKSIDAGQFPDKTLGDTSSTGWTAYMRVWKQHHQTPENTTIRRFLGLPLSGVIQAKGKAGRSAPRVLAWRAGSYRQIDTPHFTIYSKAGGEAAKRIAIDLENCYWIWTQMFFPFWEGAAQVSTVMSDLGDDQSVVEYLESHTSRLSVRRKLRVVLFADAQQYQSTLAKHIPGIERSTGFYSDPQQTIFLYAAQQDDAATRRHELVHQLFRQATRSSLGRNMPGEESGFWLVEGIAGYFESLHLDRGVATVGGWDASRLQFARYRMFAAGDSMPFTELIGDGRQAAQTRTDIARWYAHAIAHVHRLMDDGNTEHRQWLYRQLADCYRIKSTFQGQDPTDSERGLIEFLKIDDNVILQNPVDRELTQLCLVGCEVTANSLKTVPPSRAIQWLDLSRLPIRTEDVVRLAPNPGSLRQLSLEATKTDPGLASFFKQARGIEELDVSWLPLDDRTFDAIVSADKLQTLWLTGTKVSDQSIGKIASLRELQAVDLQRTNVTDAGLKKLKQARPNLNINPLELRSQ